MGIYFREYSFSTNFVNVVELFVGLHPDAAVLDLKNQSCSVKLVFYSKKEESVCTSCAHCT